MKKQTLRLDQIASLCGVSLNRVRRWIEKRGLKVDPSQGSGETILHTDMIDFLVKYNMPIPDSIMPTQAKKILFIYCNDSDEKLFSPQGHKFRTSRRAAQLSFMRFLVNFLGQLKNEQYDFIADHISYGPNTKMKVMVFKPDLIILDMTGQDQDAIGMSILIKNIEDFNSVKLIAITAPDLLERYQVSAAKSGIDEVLGESVPMQPLAKRLMGF